jgi:hypothetical protein
MLSKVSGTPVHAAGVMGKPFVSMTVNHRNQGESPSTKVYECIQKFYDYLHKADPTATITRCTMKRKRMATSLSQLLNPPPSLLIYLASTITYRSATRTPRVWQTGTMTRGTPSPTYVVLWVTTKYAFDHLNGLIQSYLTKMNMFLKEKEMPSLNTRTCLAIIGTTADWCPISLQKTLHKDLELHLENLQMSGQVDAKFCHHRVPVILLWKNIMRMPKMNSLMSKQDIEFIDYY